MDNLVVRIQTYILSRLSRTVKETKRHKKKKKTVEDFKYTVIHAKGT